MANKGWIKVHRQLQDCDIWVDEEPFDRRSAWIDLLLSCNHEDKSLIFDGHRMVVQRGQILTSVRRLSERWHWGKDRTLRFLRLLEELEMIQRESNARRTLLTVVKYEVFQDVADSNKDTDKDSYEDTDKDTHKDTHKDTDKPQTRMIKNEKNEKNKYIVGKVIEYLNQVLGTRYTTKNKSTFEKINARIEEGHSFDDFKIVIDKKFKQWGNDSRMSTYLRPETLFAASHFESYLNEREVVDGNAKGRIRGNAESDEDTEREREIAEIIRRIESGEADHDDDGLWD